MNQALWAPMASLALLLTASCTQRPSRPCDEGDLVCPEDMPDTGTRPIPAQPVTGRLEVLVYFDDAPLAVDVHASLNDATYTWSSPEEGPIPAPIGTYELGFGDQPPGAAWSSRLPDGTRLVAPPAQALVQEDELTSSRFDANLFFEGAWRCSTERWAYLATASDYRGEPIEQLQAPQWSISVEAGERVTNTTDPTFGGLLPTGTSLRVHGSGLQLDGPPGLLAVQRSEVQSNDTGRRLLLDLLVGSEQVVEVLCAGVME